VYQGAPTPVTAFMASVGKAAAFAAMIRVLVVALPFYKDDWRPIVWVLALITLLVGSILAVVQNNVKRMLAYSSIAHAGYALMGLVAASEAGLWSVLLYLTVYAFMNLGAFAVVTALQRRPGVTSQLATFTGLGYRAPVLALTMTVFLLSLTGIPPLAGFFAKAIVVLGALEVGGAMTWLAVIMMLNAAAAAFYYLRVVVYMYMRKPAEDAPRVSLGGLTRVGLVVAAALTILIGLFPPITGALLDWTEAAAVALAQV